MLLLERGIFLHVLVSYTKVKNNVEILINILVNFVSMLVNLFEQNTLCHKYIFIVILINLKSSRMSTSKLFCVIGPN